MKNALLGNRSACSFHPFGDHGHQGTPQERTPISLLPWASYLEKHFALPADHLHGTAERLEHVTDGEMQGRLPAIFNFPVAVPLISTLGGAP